VQWLLHNHASWQRSQFNLIYIIHIQHDPINMACLVQHATCCSVVGDFHFNLSHVRIPLVLGGGANGLRLATHLRQTTSTRSTWWMPFYHAETKAEVPALMQRISEESEESVEKTCCEKDKKRWACSCLEPSIRT